MLVTLGTSSVPDPDPEIRWMPGLQKTFFGPSV